MAEIDARALALSLSVLKSLTTNARLSVAGAVAGFSAAATEAQAGSGSSSTKGETIPPGPTTPLE